MISNCCHRFHEWQVERNVHSQMRKFPPLCLFVLLPLRQRDARSHIYDAFRTESGNSGGGAKIPDNSRGSAEMSVRPLGAAECR